jgi:hypothetical protein
LDCYHALSFGNDQCFQCDKQIHKGCRRAFWDAHHCSVPAASYQGAAISSKSLLFCTMQEMLNMHPVYLQGIVSEFSKPLEFEIADRTSPIYQFQWVYVNGLLGVIFSIGLLYTALKTRRARSWLYGIGWSHVFYCAPYLVVVSANRTLMSHHTSFKSMASFQF